MADIRIGYKELLRVSGRSIQQLRRCALTLFGVDPDAGRQGGVAREFSLTEGFAIYLAAVLVGDHDLRISEASQHVLKYLWNVGRQGPEADLTDLNFLRPPKWQMDHPVADVILRIYPGPCPVYEFRVFPEKPEVAENWTKFTQEKIEKFKSYWLPGAAMTKDGSSRGMIYELRLLAHLGHYFKVLRSSGL